MVIPLPLTTSVPTLCRQLFAKKIHPNITINNLFPHHGPGFARTAYEDWYAVCLQEGRRVTLILEGAKDFARIYLRDVDGEIVEYAYSKTRGNTLSLTILKLPRGGTHYIIVQMDEAYSSGGSNSGGGGGGVSSNASGGRYRLTVVH